VSQFPMAKSTAFGGLAVLVFLTGLASASLLSGCTPETYTDQNFGTNLGADFVAPPADAGRTSNEVDGGAD
jgi:hypothetical protein